MTKRYLSFVLLFTAACAAPMANPESEGVDVEADALTQARSCAVILCREGTHCEDTGGVARCIPNPPVPLPCNKLSNTGCIPKPTPKPLCAVDSDCRAVANYCDGCECLALGPGQSVPECTGTPVQCFVDPCLGKSASCSGGQCVIAPSQPACQTDSDCHLAANYCDGCDCVVLGPGQSVPKCTGTPVQCLIDPCLGQTAACIQGQCVGGNGI